MQHCSMMGWRTIHLKTYSPASLCQWLPHSANTNSVVLNLVLSMHILYIVLHYHHRIKCPLRMIILFNTSILFCLQIQKNKWRFYRVRGAAVSSETKMSRKAILCWYAQSSFRQVYVYKSTNLGLSMSSIDSGRLAFRVSGSSRHEIPQKMATEQMMIWGRRVHKSSSNKTSGAIETPRRLMKLL